eukprot:8135796-Heterocapsa_arctica.AAC.1
MPGLIRLNPTTHDPFGLWADQTHEWRYCPNQTGDYACGIVIPASFTVCPYCTAPLTFTPALADGAERRMPMAAAAVAMA